MLEKKVLHNIQNVARTSTLKAMEGLAKNDMSTRQKKATVSKMGVHHNKRAVNQTERKAAQMKLKERESVESQGAT